MSAENSSPDPATSAMSTKECPEVDKPVHQPPPKSPTTITAEENQPPVADPSMDPQEAAELVQVVEKLSITPPPPQPPSAIVVNKDNKSLKSLLAYESDSDEESIEDGLQVPPEAWRYNMEVISSDDEEEDDDESSDVEISSSDVEETIHVLEKQGAIKKTGRADSKATAWQDNLPPVPDLENLRLEMDKLEFVQMGVIITIVEKMVTINSLPDAPAYDIETILFYGDQKKLLGQIFDVLGPVTRPIYVVRFNTTEDIAKLQLQPGMKVFTAPKSEYTQYVFLQELLAMKGTDASWVGDEPTPEEEADFSDDEQERVRTNPRRRGPKRPHTSQERHRRFERTMNQCNSLNTRMHKLIDSHHSHASGMIRPSEVPRPMVVFDPSVPPPMLAPQTPSCFWPHNEHLLARTNPAMLPQAPAAMIPYLTAAARRPPPPPSGAPPQP